jgi:C-terminal processing protease CtpA/Prc
MAEADVADVVGQVRALVEARYVFSDIGAEISKLLAERLAQGRYPSEPEELAAVVTPDLQSVNRDQHLRLLYHSEALPQRAPDDDAEEYAAMARWANQTCGGVAAVQRLDGNIGYLDLQPVLFPAAIAGERITAAFTLLADTDALIIDVRACLGGEPSAVAFFISYIWDSEPVQLSGLMERSQLAQSWTLAYVPGRRFGKTKPVYILTSATTFSGAEQLGYDLQQLGRASILGERTRGGAHARVGFTVHEHFEATIPVAEAINPKSGSNWEGTGVVPDIEVPAAQALDLAHQHALQHVTAISGVSAPEATT